MKVIIVMATLGFVTSGLAHKKPKCLNHNSKMAILPNPDDCGSYFQCYHGYPTLIKCHHGKHFDPKRLKCTHPHRANCRVTTTTERPTSTTFATTQNPTTTTTITQKLPATITTTQKPTTTTTQKPTTATTTTQKPRTATTTTQKPTTTIIQKSTTTITTTKKPTTTTTTTQKSTTTTSTTQKPTTTTPKPSPSYPVSCPAPNGSGDIVLLPNPKDCSTYFRCQEGVPIIISCDKILHFDPHNLYCTYPEEAGCEVTTTPVITTPSTSSKPTPMDSTTQKQTPKASTTQKPTPTTSTTQKPTPTDSTTQKLTPTASTTQKPTPTTSTKPVTCPPDNRFIKLPNPYDSSSYYECREGVPNLMSCPNGLHFNPVKLECAFPEDDGCEVSTTPSTITTTTSIPVKCPPSNGPNELIFIPHPKDCGTFYQCSHGYPWLMKCPSDLHFWPEKKRCDYPHNAECVIS